MNIVNLCKEFEKIQEFNKDGKRFYPKFKKKPLWKYQLIKHNIDKSKKEK